MTFGNGVERISSGKEPFEELEEKGGGLFGSFKDLPGLNAQAFRDAFEGVYPDIGWIAPLNRLQVFVFNVTDLRELGLCKPPLVAQFFDF